MSLVFGKKRTIRRGKRRIDEGKAAARYGGRTVKYWELYGTLDSLGIGLSKNIIDETVPDGHCAELYALGCKIHTMGTAARKTLDLEIGYDGGKKTGIRFGIANQAFGGESGVLPWGDSLNPPLLLDYPMRKGNLTVKFNEGQDIELILTADQVAIDKDVYAKAKVLLYEPADVAALYGAGISNFATLAGGVSQALPHRVFADYAIAPALAGDAKWTECYSKKVQDYEQIMLSHLGFHSFSVSLAPYDALRLYDYRTKKEFPEYEPYWKISADNNMLPIGGDLTTVPIQKLPSVVAEYVWSNTTLYVYFRDDGTDVVSEGYGGLQLLGTYRRVR